MILDSNVLLLSQSPGDGEYLYPSWIRFGYYDYIDVTLWKVSPYQEVDGILGMLSGLSMEISIQRAVNIPRTEPQHQVNFSLHIMFKFRLRRRVITLIDTEQV